MNRLIKNLPSKLLTNLSSYCNVYTSSALFGIQKFIKQQNLLENVSKMATANIVHQQFYCTSSSCKKKKSNTCMSSQTKKKKKKKKKRRCGPEPMCPPKLLDEENKCKPKPGQTAPSSSKCGGKQVLRLTNCRISKSGGKCVIQCDIEDDPPSPPCPKKKKSCDEKKTTKCNKDDVAVKKKNSKVCEMEVSTESLSNGKFVTIKFDPNKCKKIPFKCDQAGGSTCKSAKSSTKSSKSSMPKKSKSCPIKMPEKKSCKSDKKPSCASKKNEKRLCNSDMIKASCKLKEPEKKLCKSERKTSCTSKKASSSSFSNKCAKQAVKKSSACSRMSKSKMATPKLNTKLPEPNAPNNSLIGGTTEFLKAICSVFITSKPPQMPKIIESKSLVEQCRNLPPMKQCAAIVKEGKFKLDDCGEFEMPQLHQCGQQQQQQSNMKKCHSVSSPYCRSNRQTCDGSGGKQTKSMVNCKDLSPMKQCASIVQQGKFKLDKCSEFDLPAIPKICEKIKLSRCPTTLNTSTPSTTSKCKRGKDPCKSSSSKKKLSKCQNRSVHNFPTARHQSIDNLMTACQNNECDFTVLYTRHHTNNNNASVGNLIMKPTATICQTRIVHNFPTRSQTDDLWKKSNEIRSKKCNDVRRSRHYKKRITCNFPVRQRTTGDLLNKCKNAAMAACQQTRIIDKLSSRHHSTGDLMKQQSQNNKISISVCQLLMLQKKKLSTCPETVVVAHDQQQCHISKPLIKHKMVAQSKRQLMVCRKSRSIQTNTIHNLPLKLYDRSKSMPYLGTFYTQKRNIHTTDGDKSKKDGNCKKVPSSNSCGAKKKMNDRKPVKRICVKMEKDKPKSVGSNGKRNSTWTKFDGCNQKTMRKANDPCGGTGGGSVKPPIKKKRVSACEMLLKQPKSTCPKAVKSNAKPRPSCKTSKKSTIKPRVMKACKKASVCDKKKSPKKDPCKKDEKMATVCDKKTKSPCDKPKSTCDKPKSPCDKPKSACKKSKPTCKKSKMTCKKPKSTCGKSNSKCGSKKSACKPKPKCGQKNSECKPKKKISKCSQKKKETCGGSKKSSCETKKSKSKCKMSKKPSCDGDNKKSVCGAKEEEKVDKIVWTKFDGCKKKNDKPKDKCKSTCSSKNKKKKKEKEKPKSAPCNPDGIKDSCKKSPKKAMSVPSCGTSPKNSPKKAMSAPSCNRGAKKDICSGKKSVKRKQSSCSMLLQKKSTAKPRPACKFIEKPKVKCKPPKKCVPRRPPLPIYSRMGKPKMNLCARKRPKKLKKCKWPPPAKSASDPCRKNYSTRIEVYKGQAPTCRKQKEDKCKREKLFRQCMTMMEDQCSRPCPEGSGACGDGGNDDVGVVTDDCCDNSNNKESDNNRGGDCDLPKS